MPSTSPRRASASMPRIRDKAVSSAATTARTTGSRGLIRGTATVDPGRRAARGRHAAGAVGLSLEQDLAWACASPCWLEPPAASCPHGSNAVRAGDRP